jgi:hypothetical protein
MESACRLNPPQRTATVRERPQLHPRALSWFAWSVPAAFSLKKGMPFPRVKIANREDH